MSIYINQFDNQINVNGASTVLAFDPDYDSGTWIKTPQLGIVKSYFGVMKQGMSEPQGAMGTLTYASPGIGPNGVFDPGGLTIQVIQNKTPEAAEQPESETVYLLFPNLQIIGPGRITAELMFDMPKGSGAATDVWAIALNFKQGDQNDTGSADLTFGPTCQFNGQGQFRLHLTTPHQNFISHPPTEFVLKTELIVGGTGVTGFATLQYGTKTESGEVSLPAGFDLSLVDAVGFAITTPKNTLESFSARFRRFTLSAPDQFFLLRQSWKVPGELRFIPERTPIGDSIPQVRPRAQ